MSIYSLGSGQPGGSVNLKQDSSMSCFFFFFKEDVNMSVSMFIFDRLVLLTAAPCDPEQNNSLENDLTETETHCSGLWVCSLVLLL